MANLSRLEDRADLQISLVLLASWVAITITSNWGNWPPDLSALFMAGHFWSTGQESLIYAAPDSFFGPGVESWANEFARLGHEGEVFFPFVYPPIWAAIAAPLAKSLGPTGFFNAFFCVHIFMIAGSILLAYRLIRPPVPMVLWCVISCGLLLLSLIASSALFHNQLQITVTFLIILSFERYKSGAFLTAGIALGIAAAIKITPAALGLIFLFDRNFKAAIATAITGFAMLALSYMVAGPELHAEFLARINQISGQIAVMHVNWNIEAYLIQLKTLIAGPPLHNLELTPNMAVPKPHWIGIVSKLVLIAGIVLVFFQTRHLSSENKLRVRPFGLLLALTLCAPLGWSHHYLPVLLLIPAVLTFMPPIRALTVLTLFGAATSLGAFSMVKPFGTQVHSQAMLNISVMIVVFLIFFARPLTFDQEPAPARKPRRSRKNPR